MPRTDVSVSLGIDDARGLYEHLLNTPMDGPQWEWNALVALADTLGEELPEWMREKATA